MKKIIKCKKPSIRWSSLLSVEDIVPRRGRFGRYCVLYTNAGNTVCCNEDLAQHLCLFEPYEMFGEVKVFHGGVYLKLERANLFEPSGYSKKTPL